MTKNCCRYWCWLRSQALLTPLPAQHAGCRPGLDDIVSLDPAEANELSSIQTVPSLYQRLVQPDRDNPEKSRRFWQKAGTRTRQQNPDHQA